METHYEEFKHPNMMSVAESQNFQMINGIKVYVVPDMDEKSHFDPLDYEKNERERFHLLFKEVR